MNNDINLKTDNKVDLINKGFVLPSRFLPMNEVVNYLKINISYLQKMSKEISD